MDFGDILDQWEKQKKDDAKKKKEASKIQVSHKKANAPEKPSKQAGAAAGSTTGSGASASSSAADSSSDFEKRINPMELWLRRYGTSIHGQRSGRPLMYPFPRSLHEDPLLRQESGLSAIRR